MYKRSATALLVLAILLVLTQVYLAQPHEGFDPAWNPLGSGDTSPSDTWGQCVPGSSLGGNTAQEAGSWQGEGDRPAGIVLTSFTARVSGMAVRIRWKTASEQDLLGFHLHRAETPTGTRTRITAKLIPGKGNSTQGASYEWLDETVTPYQVYLYWLEAMDADEISTFYGPVVALPPCKWEIFLPVIRRQHLEP